MYILAHRDISGFARVDEVHTLWATSQTGQAEPQLASTKPVHPKTAKACLTHLKIAMANAKWRPMVHVLGYSEMLSEGLHYYHPEQH